MYRGAVSKRHTRTVFLRLIGDHSYALYAFITHLARHLIHANGAVDRLPTGHGDSIVVEDLVGNVDACRNGCPDGMGARVEVGAITQVLEYMIGFHKRRLADPGDTLTAHLAESIGLAIHPGHHVVTTHSAQCAAAIGYFGGCVVRAAGTEIGRTLHTQRWQLRGALDHSTQALDPGLHQLGIMEMSDTTGDDQGNFIGGDSLGIVQ